MNFFLKSKIHRAKVTDCKKDYIGSISICPILMKKSGIKKYEKVSVWNVTNGARIETYAIPAKEKQIIINGSAVHHFNKNDLIIIASFEITNKPNPKSILVDENNSFLKYL